MTQNPQQSLESFLDLYMVKSQDLWSCTWSNLKTRRARCCACQVQSCRGVFVQARLLMLQPLLPASGGDVSLQPAAAHYEAVTVTHDGEEPFEVHPLPSPYLSFAPFPS